MSASQAHSSLVKLAFFAVAAITCGNIAYAQLSTASVTGIVRDSSGGVVPDAKVTLRNAETAGVRTTTANSAGNYNFLNVNPGRYSMESTA